MSVLLGTCAQIRSEVGLSVTLQWHPPSLGITSWLLWTLLLLTSNRRLSVTVFALQRGWGCVRAWVET